ncbi:MAG TPA: OmpA family protein [Gemmatimonadales bacterium]|nr:OmpA family protein [Gemmatimonadales bacterium]
MTRCGLLMAGLALAVGPLAAQHAGQFEVGAFGSFTRYAPAFGLANKPGGGARLGYLLGDMVGVEGDVLFQAPYTVVVVPGGATTTLEPLIASASLMVDLLRASRLGVYALGGYSLLDFGTRAPYNFTDHAAHAGAGARLFLSDRIAARVEGRALFTLKSQSAFGASNPTHYVFTAGLSVFHLGAAPKAPAPVAAVAPAPPPPPPPTPEPAPPKCPTPPPGTPVDSLGCALPVVAVPPAAPTPPPEPPKCPTPPPGTPVDSLGCALPVPVIVTPPPAPPPAPVAPKCPPAPPGSPVDANGCLVLFNPDSTRAAAPGAPPRPTLVLRGVNFETGRSALTRDSYLVLDAVAASLVANPEIRIEIAGYTDNTGTRYFNMRLSQGRARAVQAYLARKGVLPARMVAKGYGATGFVATNTTADGRAQNRRVELHKLP